VCGKKKYRSRNRAKLGRLAKLLRRAPPPLSAAPPRVTSESTNAKSAFLPIATEFADIAHFAFGPNPELPACPLIRGRRPRRRLRFRFDAHAFSPVWEHSKSRSGKIELISPAGQSQFSIPRPLIRRTLGQWQRWEPAGATLDGRMRAPSLSPISCKRFVTLSFSPPANRRKLRVGRES
jgi:hypothetical protein